MFEFNLMHIRTVFTVERGTVRLISIRWGQLYSTHLQTLYWRHKSWSSVGHTEE